MNLHGRPTAAELAAAVEEFLRGELMPSLEGRSRFQTLVAANVVAMIQRELDLGPDQEVRAEQRFASLGVRDDAELADAIRSGEMDGRVEEVVEVVWLNVVDKVAVANPKYLIEGT